MILYLYNISISLFSLVCKFLSLFNTKLKKRIQGLKTQTIPKSSENTMLFHCASAGEFEQIYPIIKLLRKNQPTWRIVISFFSPSGIEWLKTKQIPLECYYLPFDQKSKINQFLDKLEPNIVLIAKNELWFNFFQALQKRKIPHYLIAASFKKSHFALKYEAFIKILSSINKIFTIDEESQTRLQSSLNNAMLFGDPRIDRISEKAASPDRIPLIESRKDKPIIVYASMHREDTFLLDGIRTDDKFLHIIVPHEIHQSEIEYFKSKLGNEITISSTDILWDNSILLVDQMGLLADLYHYTDFAYIGGGFGSGIHNLLEAAVHKNYIFVGPSNKNFNEARVLLKEKAIFEVSKNDNLLKTINKVTKSQRENAQSKIKAFFGNNRGVAQKITNEIIQDLHDIR